MSEWPEVKHSLSEWKSLLIEKRGARDQIVKIKQSEELQLIEIKEKQRLSHLGQLFLLSEIVDRRQKAVDSIEQIATHALRLIYGEGYRLQFDTFEEKRKEGASNFKMEINIASPSDDGEVITGIDDERGGGLLEIVAFALRIAALNWLGYSGPLILDEAYKSMSSDEKLTAVASFLKEITESMDRQIIFATHRGEVFGDKSENIIHIENKNGTAQATILDKYDLVAE